MHKKITAIKTSPRPLDLPTLEQLKAAISVQDKLSILQTRSGDLTGWFMGHLLIQNKNWSAVNDYILILKTLPKHLVEEQLQQHHASHKSFLELLCTPDVPASVMFNLLEHFSIGEALNTKIARLKGLKEAVKRHIEDIDLSSPQEKLFIWRKCVDISTPLGQFFRRTRTSFGYSKFKSDYAETKIVDSIQDLIQKLSLVHPTTPDIQQEPLCVVTQTENIEPALPYEPSFFSTAIEENTLELLEPNRVEDNPVLYPWELRQSTQIILALALLGAGLGILLFKLEDDNSPENTAIEEHDLTRNLVPSPFGFEQ